MGDEVKVHPELAALRAQADTIADLLDELEPADLQRPTRCPAFSVRELVAHTAVVLLLANKLLDRPAKGKPTRDRVTWWGSFDPDEAQKVIVDVAREKASKRDDADLVSWWRSVVEDALGRFADGPPGRIVGSDDVHISAADLAATRVVELGVHGMDIGHATLRGERLDPKAAEVIVGILDGLLDAPLPKAIGWTPRTYILTATGRRPMERNERFVLGDLADRFPLIR